MIDPAPPGVVPERFVAAYRTMLLARVFEEKLASLYRGGKITGGCYIGRGQEALSVACGMALVRGGDLFAPSIRDQAGRLAFGETLLDAARTYLGSKLGPMAGRDGNVHRGSPADGCLAMISHLGAMVSAVAGGLLARRMLGREGAVGLVCLGDGATSTGAFHEGLNLASVERVPVVVVVANNGYAYSTPNERQFACANLADRAPGYGIRGSAVAGNDLEACMRVIGEAVARARAGGGPELVVAQLLRLCGHGEHDDAKYIDPRIAEMPHARDCIVVARERIEREGWAQAREMEEWRRETLDDVERAVAQAQREPPPDGTAERWCALSVGRLADPPLPEGDEGPTKGEARRP